MKKKEITLKPKKIKKKGKLYKLLENKKTRYLMIPVFILPILIAIGIFGYVIYRDTKTLLNTATGNTEAKPENIVEKMVEGRMKKYYAESVLEEQPFVMDPSKTVKQVLDEAGGKLAGFAYFVLGEGVEKREDNLADEVAKMLH